MNKPASYNFGFAITPSDTVNFTRTCEAIYIGSVGIAATMVVVFADGSTVAFAGLVAGSIIPVKAKRVNSTGTGATSLVALGLLG